MQNKKVYIRDQTDRLKIFILFKTKQKV